MSQQHDSIEILSQNEFIKESRLTNQGKRNCVKAAGCIKLPGSFGAAKRIDLSTFLSGNISKKTVNKKVRFETSEILTKQPEIISDYKINTVSSDKKECTEGFTASLCKQLPDMRFMILTTLVYVSQQVLIG